LALRGRGGADVEVDDIGGQALGRDLERGARARGALEEHVEHRAPAQERHLLHLALAHRDELVGGVEDAADRLDRKPLRREQVAQLPVASDLQGIVAHRAHARLFIAASRSLPDSLESTSSSSARTSTRAPTKSAATGSSRPPRSASTARRTARGRPKSKSSFKAARTVRPV